MAKLTNEEIIASLKEMSVLELNELVKAVEAEFGVTAAVAAAAAPAEEEGPVNAGPAEVSLFLKGLGTGSKVAIIKAVQAITGLGLMDAKNLMKEGEFLWFDLDGVDEDAVVLSQIAEMKDISCKAL